MCVTQSCRKVHYAKITRFNSSLLGFEDKGIQIDEADLQVLCRENSLHVPLQDYLDPEFRRLADEYMTHHSLIVFPLSDLKDAQAVYINLVRYFENILHE